MTGGSIAAALREEGRAQPVAAAVPALLAALREEGCAVLAAPPGTGKTTLVPLMAADAFGADGGRVLVAEPRRMAARAAARRMAWLLGEQVGGTVGFTVRGERKVSARTAVEVVTTGVLLQRLQRDPELAGVGTVMLDECHERHLDADTATAFLLDVRAVLRPGLRLVAASATTDTAAWARLLGGPVVEAAGGPHPVAVEWAPPTRPVRPPHGMRVDPALLEHVAATVRRALRERTGDVLCFLPGAGEIARVAGLLNAGPDVDVLHLHGRAPAAVQDAALAPGERRRVLLATSVAESSLTVPGVRVVVDAGLTREPRMDHARGLGALTTVRVSRAAADQRAGRAGREGPGTVYRCWAEAEHARLARQPAPEIALADLTAFALHAACWGEPDTTGLALLDPAPAGALAAARATLHGLGAVDDAGRATDRGRRLALLGLHPRLGRALLDAAPLIGAERAAAVTALLSEELPTSYGPDLAAAWRTARHAADPYATRWRAETRRLRSALTAATEKSAAPPPTTAPGPEQPSGDRGFRGPGRTEDGAGASARGTNTVGGPSPDARAGRSRPATPPATGSARAPGKPASGAGKIGDRGTAGGEAEQAPARARAAGGTDSRTPDARAFGGHVRQGRPQPVAGPARTTGESPSGDGAFGSSGRAGGGAEPVPASGEVNGGTDARAPDARAFGGWGRGGDDAAAGLVAALAFPERVARRRGPGAYLMVGGTAAEVGGVLGEAEWLAVAVADRGAGRAGARARVAAVTDEEVARLAAAGAREAYEEVRWQDGDVVARRVERLGAVELAAAALRSPDRAAVRAALLDGLREEGIGLLRWTPQAVSLRQRMAFAHRVLGAPWPDVAEAALVERAEEWLGPELAVARRRADLARIEAGAALGRLLPWATGEAARFDELVPERIEVPSGSRIRVDYGSGEQPVLAVKLQEMFGLRQGPAVAGVPVLVHLLSPAGRPAAVTADLASFWAEGYRAVRAELRGRYPKHPWPEDPSAARATRHTSARATREG